MGRCGEEQRNCEQSVTGISLAAEVCIAVDSDHVRRHIKVTAPFLII